MRSYPRIRKTIKWGGATITLLLALAWIGSWWFWLGWEDRSWRGVGLGYGQVEFTRAPLRTVVVSTGAGWRFAQLRDPPRWWFSRDTLGAAEFFAIPLWFPALCCLVSTAIAWRLDTLARRRAGGRLNLCPSCTYDRTGLAADSKCPECGTLPKP